MRRLDRYILAEVLGPLALGFLVYTFILLIQVLFKSAELIIGSGVAVSTIGRLLLLSLPHIVVMTIPMALLFGILIGVGRLSTDSELTAIRASGISLFSLYRPILLLSLALTGLNTYLMLDVLPHGNQALQQLRLDILTQSLTEEIEPRLPYTEWERKVLFVFETPPGEQTWRGVFLADSIPSGETEVTVAGTGRARTDDQTGQVHLQLESAVNHVVDFANPATYNAVSQETQSLLLVSGARRRATSTSRSLRELTLPELRRVVRNPADGGFATQDPKDAEKIRNIALTEIHKKFSFPAACLVFGLLGLPLGFSSARGGRSSGFALSIGVVLVYYLIFNSGEEAARDGTVPVALAVWTPNVLLLAAGVFLLARRNRDKSLLIQNFDRWIQEKAWGRLLRAKADREAKQQIRRERARRLRRRRARLVVRLPELRLRFPNSIDRYVLSRFLGVLFVVMLSGVVMYLIVDFSENLEDVLEREIPHSVVVDYYKYKSFSVIYEIAPIIVLVTTLTTFGLLSRTNEVVACKAVGISLYRLAVPVVVAAALLAALAGVLQSEVLPASNAQVAELKAVIKGQAQQRAPGRRADRQWLYGKNQRLYNYGYYDLERRELQNLQIFKFDDSYRLVGRLFVERATHIEGPWWTFSRGWARTFDGRDITGFSRFDEPMKYRLEEAPEYFEGGLTPPDEMNYAELEDYIDELKAAGQEVPELEVALYNKIAYPVISLVMALVGLPFGFRLGHRGGGALYGIGLSLVLGIILMVVLTLFNALGTSAILPPLVAIWSPAVLFSIFSLYLFLGVRS